VAAGSRRAWGWHPLVDAWAERIVADADIKPRDLVLDIGAGHGALTRHLVAAGARVLAVEPHPARAARLRERFAGLPVRVVEVTADALLLPDHPFRVVASPPFSISTALVRHLLGSHSGLVAADLVLQLATVRRLVESGGTWRRRWSLTEGNRVPRRAFLPPPRVDTAVLVVRRTSAGPPGRRGSH
jgi:23S rRNA (adenine-N6)-dimethyltransferase